MGEPRKATTGESNAGDHGSERKTEAEELRAEEESAAAMDAEVPQPQPDEAEEEERDDQSGV